MRQTSIMISVTIILVCLVYIASGSTPPPARLATSCTVVGTNIYCYGGDNRVNGVDAILSDTWALSIANDFDLSNPTWTNKPWNNFPSTPRAFGTIHSLLDGSSFLLNGGLTSPVGSAETNQTIVHNTITNEWKAINSSLIAQTLNHQGVIDANGKIWYFGGVSDSDTGRSNVSYWEGLAALDTNTWLWTTSRGTTGGYLNPRIGHTMTILSNGIIQIIGGNVATLLSGLDSRGYLQWRLDLAPMGSVAVYDTVKGTWTTKSATGTIPPHRNFHSATLAQDSNTIIVFGGSGSGNGSSLFNDLYALDSNKMTWTHIDIGNGPSARYGHSVNETMFILFGINASNSSLSDIYALDTVNWIWVQHFSASGYSQQANMSYPAAINGTSSTSESTDSSGGNSLGAGPIAGIAVGAVLVVAVIGAVYFMRRRKRSRQDDLDGLQTELVESNLGDKSAEGKAPTQKDWYTATFRGTDTTGSIPPEYHSHIVSYNAKPNAVDDLAISSQSKPNEYD
ncbi:hypothetical protein K450DRAFT_228718 [Umbelopsis ramanniana AG]|uniref:Galactose oxidase n=1 Tax=Umbelopsis ramanniana AG TaxID=1314678 RepID=A0AAD5HGE5_UMBRA|nr:uncharacterized protein K450DRAFT_228718 [Umbelopsis ramanniana AG]KAI8582029.1 hypothetical protein K450DRAFT_228718 [Umbelopsis ramanniana AG]